MTIKERNFIKGTNQLEILQSRNTKTEMKKVDVLKCKFEQLEERISEVENRS